MIPPPDQDQDQRRTRHLDMLEELATLAMALTREAAEKAQQHIDEPAEGPDPILAFTRLAATIRQIIALEARIASPAQKPSRLYPSNEPTNAAEPRAAAVPDGTEANPVATRTHVERHIDERIDADDITCMLDDETDVGDIIETIRDSLGIPCDIARQPGQTILTIERADEDRREPRAPRHPPNLEHDQPERKVAPTATPPPSITSD